jgi:hypothetical protein
MALSPADFAAYSRATGTPYPEDPEERAQITPAVLEFRRNQLRAPQEESNLPGILGVAALGLSALAGGVGIARALAGKRGQASASTASTLPKNTEQVVNTVSAAPLRQQIAEEVVRQARTERPLGTVLIDLPQPKTSFDPWSGKTTITDPFGTGTLPYARTDLPISRTPGTFREFSRDVSGASVADRLSQDPELLSLVQKQAAEELSEARSFQSKAQAEYRNLISSIADDIIAQERAAVRGPVVDQVIGALGSGEDQMTGRTMRGVQRNEDLDASQVNTVARQIGSADVAASLTPDGIPVDQTDFWGQPTIPQLQKTTQNPTLLLPAAATSPREKAQEFLQSRFESLGETFPGRYRRERVMGSDPLITEAAELYAATGDPSVLSRFSKTPASPLGLKPTVQMSINDDNLPTSQFFKPTGYPEYTGDLIQRDIELTNEISNLGAKQQELLKQAKELGEQELMLRVAMDRDPAGGGAYTNMFGKVKYAQQNLQDPATLDADLGDALAERNFIRGQINSLENLGTTYKLRDVQEGVRPYFEYDELGRIIPSTFELRSGRKSIDLDPKTGGGRLVSEYDPEGQSGSTRGIYGIEQTSRRSSPTMQPTGMTMDELIREGLEQAKASPEGDVPIPPSLSDLTEQQVTPQKRSSVNMSEAILRAARLQGNRNPRGGVLPDEITMARRQLKQLDQPEEIVYRPREVIAPGSVPPQQLNLKNVTGYAARRRDTPADVAANQLEAYMSKLQRGRSTPLTSQAVIQPRLF